MRLFTCNTGTTDELLQLTSMDIYFAMCYKNKSAFNIKEGHALTVFFYSKPRCCLRTLNGKT